MQNLSAGELLVMYKMSFVIFLPTKKSKVQLRRFVGNCIRYYAVLEIEDWSKNRRFVRKLYIGLSKNRWLSYVHIFCTWDNSSNLPRDCQFWYSLGPLFHLELATSLIKIEFLSRYAFWPTFKRKTISKNNSKWFTNLFG